ncbi:hypothetical protein DL767_001476 [Monosporascus sp. MG133]|nr:hypothetical protein DL767_001476 [Monosporascus sp. MG133]
MSTENPTVFVTGVTGSQGAELSKQLRALGWGVHGIARNLESPTAKSLTALGVELTAGDWEDTGALKVGLSGCHKLFLCLTSCIEEPLREQRQADTIVSLAKEAGVTQVVSSSSLGVFMYGDEERLMPGKLLHSLIEAKHGVEQVAVGAGLESWTLLRPALFMTNFVEPYINIYTDILEHRRWITALRPDTRLALIDNKDIARYAVAAFRDPTRFHATVVGLATELLTAQETMDRLSLAMGIPKIEAVFLSEEEIAVQDPKGLLVQTRCDKSMRYMPDYLDFEALKQVIPLTTFEEFLIREKENVKKM